MVRVYSATGEAAMTISIDCGYPHCDRKAFSLEGNTIKVIARHDSRWHVTTIALADLQAQVDKATMNALLDKIGVPLLQ